jgi:hypothetical protein
MFYFFNFKKFQNVFFSSNFETIFGDFQLLDELSNFLSVLLQHRLDAQELDPML